MVDGERYGVLVVREGGGMEEEWEEEGLCVISLCYVVLYGGKG